MKRIILSFVFITICFNSWSQIIISSSDMPVAGQVYHLSSSAAIGANINKTGANQTWDYSNLISLNYREDTMLAKKDLPPAYQFLFLTSNLAERAVQDIAIGTFFSLTNVYNIYKNTSSKFEQTAFGGELSGVPVPTYINPTDVKFKFPLKYGDSSVSNSAYSFNVPSLVFYSQKRERISKVDGWGTLTIPLGTFEVIRVKSTLNDLDSISLPLIGGLPSFKRVTYEYYFLGKGQGLPLLQINASDAFGVPVPTSIVYQDTERVSFVNEPNFTTSLFSFPNPANNSVSIITDEGNQLIIRDITGRTSIVQKIIQKQTTVDISSLINGIYFIQVSDKQGNTITKKLIVER